MRSEPLAYISPGFAVSFSLSVSLTNTPPPIYLPTHILTSLLSLQVFLELVQTHPQWLSRFLLDASTLSQSCPRLWASDMLSWTLQAASKRCAHQLQAYVCACLQLRVVLAPGPGDAAAAGGGGAGGGGPQAQEQALRTSLLPPLGQALLGVVEQLVVIIRGTVPRVNQGGHPIGVHDIPSEPARVLLAYAESSPWAAAHLLQVRRRGWDGVAGASCACVLVF